jgi:putative acetyltransferase
VWKARLTVTSVDGFEIARADPLDARVRALVERQLTFGRSFTPLEHAHALEVDDLLDPAVVLFAARHGEDVLGVGALKEIEEAHGELKTMHTAEEARGRGVGRAMLDHLLSEARRRGYRRVSLETGTMDAFAPARALYESAGFAACEPFGSYRRSPHSLYLTLVLAAGSANLHSDDRQPRAAPRASRAGAIVPGRDQKRAP